MVKSKKIISCSKCEKKSISIEEFERILKSRFEKSSSSIFQNIQIARTITQVLNEMPWKISSTELPMSTCYTCPICSCIYNTVTAEPICLPCGHSFCRGCVFSLKHSILTGNCPLDTKEFFYIEELLPINYALLNSSHDPFSRICPIHNLSILGFCLNDSSLLCGKCIFSHKSHDFIELDSDKADELAEAKFESLKQLEKKLKELLITWEVYKEVLMETEEKLQKVINCHVDNLRKVESEVVLEIHSRTEKVIKCIMEYQDVIRSNGTGSVIEVIECIKYHIECAENLRGMFAFMNNCEKLAVVVEKEFDFGSPTDFTLKDVAERFKDDIKYREILLGGTT